MTILRVAEAERMIRRLEEERIDCERRLTVKTEELAHWRAVLAAYKAKVELP